MTVITHCSKPLTMGFLAVILMEEFGPGAVAVPKLTKRSKETARSHSEHKRHHKQQQKPIAEPPEYSFPRSHGYIRLNDFGSKNRRSRSHDAAIGVDDLRRSGVRRDHQRHAIFYGAQHRREIVLKRLRRFSEPNVVGKLDELTALLATDSRASGAKRFSQQISAPTLTPLGNWKR